MAGFDGQTFRNLIGEELP